MFTTKERVEYTEGHEAYSTGLEEPIEMQV